MATRLGKRPHPKNYAMYDPRGKAKYRKDLAEYFHNYEEMSQYRYIFLKYSVCLTPRYLFFKS